MLSAVVLGVILLGVALLALRKPLYAGTPTETSKEGAKVITRETIEKAIEEKSRKYGLEIAMVKAFCEIESSFNPNAINPADPSYGIMQIMPICAQDYGYVKDWRNTTQKEIDRLLDLDTSLEIGCRHFSGILARHRTSYGLEGCVQMYNRGVHGYINLGRRNIPYWNNWRKAYISYGGKI